MKIFVKPVNGLKVKRPDNGRFLSPEGEFVPKNTFWARRVSEGDVKIIDVKEDEKIAVKKEGVTK